MMRIPSLSIVALALAAGAFLPATVSAATRHPVHHPAVADHPLTITAHHGIYRRGNDIIAPGGFSAQGYGYPAVTPDERREALNERIRENASGPYAAGVNEGIFEGRDGGYTNPYYGNTFNRYIGFNGVPSTLAFGPGYANRYAAEHDPFDDDEPPGPTPTDLGFTPSP